MINSGSAVSFPHNPFSRPYVLFSKSYLLDTKLHYEQHLSHFYSWMAGEFELKAEEQKTFFKSHKIVPQSNGIALDLGAGHGLQSIPLAQLGFSVKAIDFSPLLLRELNERKAGLPIETIEDDFTDFGPFASLHPELIVCMGDTISHLGSLSQLAALTAQAFQLLQTGGRLVYSFRDYSAALEDTGRFIPVKSDAHRIHTCMLEYQEDRVRVTDLLHEKAGEQWVQKASSYWKLRLRPELVESLLVESGFTVRHKEVRNRMVYLLANKS